MASAPNSAQCERKASSTEAESASAALRGVERNGKTPDQQLVDGLKVIGGQIDEMAGQLAQGDLDALSTRGRYLEIKYQGDQAGV